MKTCLLLLTLVLGSTLLLPACSTTAREVNENGLTEAEAEAAGLPPVAGAKWRKGHYVTRGMKTSYVPGIWVY